MIKKILLLLALFFNMALFADVAYNNGLEAYQAKQYTPALKYFYVSARHHNVNAYVELGAMHEYGIGTGTNLPTAFYWYEKAAKRNHPRAQYHLGHLYETGQGVKKDSKKAYAWYHRAARNGNKDARDRLAGKPLKEQPPTAEASGGFFNSLAFWKGDDSEDTQAKDDSRDTQAKAAEESDSEKEKPSSEADENGTFFSNLAFWKRSSDTEDNQTVLTEEADKKEPGREEPLTTNIDESPESNESNESNKSLMDKLKFWK